MWMIFIAVNRCGLVPADVTTVEWRLLDCPLFVYLFVGCIQYFFFKTNRIHSTMLRSIRSKKSSASKMRETYPTTSITSTSQPVETFRNGPFHRWKRNCVQLRSHPHRVQHPSPRCHFPPPPPFPSIHSPLGWLIIHNFKLCKWGSHLISSASWMIPIKLLLNRIVIELIEGNSALIEDSGRGRGRSCDERWWALWSWRHVTHV